MSESTLALKKADFQEKTALFLGWGRGADNGDPAWDARQLSLLKQFVDSGVRQVYWPALEGGQTYDWAFLKPIATLTLASGASVVPLPDDFGGMEGKVTIRSSTTSQDFQEVPFVGVGQVYAKFSLWPDMTGVPMMVCTEPLKGTMGQRSSRSQLRFYPTADAAYTIQFAYYLLADCLSDAYPYAYGGAAHAETFLEGCLAAAEAFLDDQLGIHRALFQQRLQASIHQDRRLKPQLMRYNADRSDVRQQQYLHRDTNPVTYDGVDYSQG